MAESPTGKANCYRGSIATQSSGHGALTAEMADFVRNMWLQQDKPVLNPKSLFMELCSRVPRFGHRQQQDAVEALRYLLDGLDNEALKVEAEADITKKNLPLKVSEVYKRYNPDFTGRYILPACSLMTDDMDDVESPTIIFKF